jgi:hypothetical protein
MPATLLTSPPRPQQVPGELVTCPECDAERSDPLRPCPACGAPPLQPDLRAHEEEVRDEDLQPYVALRYIARLFKVLAALMLVMYAGEVITGVSTAGMTITTLITLLGEGSRTLVFAGLMWAGGDITLLLIDAGHDLRVVRILLGRTNAAMQDRTRAPHVESIAGGSLGKS